MRIGFTGAGNMGSAMVRGMLSKGAVRGRDVSVWDALPGRAEALAAELGIVSRGSNLEVIGCSDLVFVAVKPDQVWGFL
ncbi:MAG: NAD(P)-binding domain-containing protein, partial [Oscillospiraceae bacterium]|nr:NAD(P)-binding domain-containing protein [Oscillospiraceae bacterium]